MSRIYLSYRARFYSFFYLHSLAQKPCEFV